jgi:hypothetical protein
VSAATTFLQIGEWSWSLPSASSGTAELTARVSNDSLGGTSGSLGITLRLSTLPFGQGGYFYEVAEYVGFTPLQAGYYNTFTASQPFSLASVPDGTYYVVAVVSEYDGFEYAVADGATGDQMYTITTNAPPPPPPVLPSDLTPPTALLKGKSVVTGGRNYKFTVTYLDTGGLELNDIDTNDITVSDEWGNTDVPLMVKVKANRLGTKCTVTYTIAPAGGRWYADDNGTYTISLGDGEVTDQAGNAAPGGYWTFVVQARRSNPFALNAKIGPASAGLVGISEEILTGGRRLLAA